jgi:Sec-independent protein translocase protein TatA
MFNLGPGEMLVIFALFFIFVKPEELPAFIRKAGNIYSQFKGLVVEAREFGNNLSKMEDAVSVEEDAVPVEEDAVPVEEDAVPVEEDAVSGERDDLLDVYINPDKGD